MLVGNEFAQTIVFLDSVNKKTHARAISIQNGNLWLGDNLGRVTQFRISDFMKLNSFKFDPEIRDIHVSENDINIMQTGDTGKVFSISNLQNLRFTPSKNGIPVFLNSFDFEDNFGFLMGDPYEGEFSLFYTNDFGENWVPISNVKSQEGEAGYAASGSIVKVLNKKLYFVTGGLNSRIFISKNKGRSWKNYSIPYQKSEGEGPYSLCIIDKKNMVVVGGNYKEKNRKSSSAYYSKDAGKSWLESPTIGGYRSCVIHNEGILYACGSNGADFSTDKGVTWTNWLDGNFIAMACDGKELIYLTLANNLGIQIEKTIIQAVIINSKIDRH